MALVQLYTVCGRGARRCSFGGVIEPSEELPWEATFVANIRRARMALGVSQTELARRVTARGVQGFHQQTVQRIESGTRPVRLNEAVTLADSLAMNLYETLGPSTTQEAARNIVSFVSMAQGRWGIHYGEAIELRSVADEDIATLDTLTAVYEASALDEGTVVDHEWLGRLSEIRERLGEAASAGEVMAMTWSRLRHPSRSIGLPNGIDPEA